MYKKVPLEKLIKYYKLHLKENNKESAAKN